MTSPWCTFPGLCPSQVAETSRPRCRRTNYTLGGVHPGEVQGLGYEGP